MAAMPSLSFSSPFQKTEIAKVRAQSSGCVSRKDTKNCIKNGTSKSMLLLMAVLALRSNATDSI